MATDMLVENSFIALVGSPNCGKTALFNALTGSRQKVANYPGVTVEKKEGFFLTKQGKSIHILDLPGTYSLRARSPDEEVTRDVVLGKFSGQTVPDVIVCVADATNLHLGLRLVLELKKIGKPIVLALNMMDVAQKRGYDIDLQILSKQIQVPVIPTVAIKKTGIAKLMSAVEEELGRLGVDPVVKPRGDTSVLSTPQNESFSWTEPNAQEIRAYHKNVEQILCIANRRQGSSSKWTKRLDDFLLHPVAGLFSLLFILFFMFQAVFTWAKIPQDLIQSGFDTLQATITNTMSDGVLRSLLADGIVAGVGSVVVFLPQIVTLFFFILMLEDSGYMARAAFLMDRLMGGVGLHGRAFIPLLSSFACAIPGIMSARTIENKKDRIITILIVPLMTCSARIPVYTLIIGAFIPSKKIFGFLNLQGLVMFALYAAGIGVALIVALILKTFFLKGGKTPLLIELPTYKIPSARNVLIGLMERAKVFLQKAGTIILAVMIVIWFLSSYPAPPAGATEPAIHYSFAGIIGHALEPFFAPVGFNWQIVIALIPGMAAREVAVAVLGTIYAISGSEEAVRQSLSVTLSHAWSLPTALALLVWYAFAQQCASTLAVTKRETNSWRWPIIMFVYMSCLAYLASFVVYHAARYFL